MVACALHIRDRKLARFLTSNPAPERPGFIAPSIGVIAARVATLRWPLDPNLRGGLTRK